MVKTELKFDNQLLKKAHRVLRACNHGLRYKMLQHIHRSGSLTVTEIYQHFGIEQSVCSQHLALLRNAGLVHTRRNARHVYYTVNQQRLQEIEEHAKNLVI